MKIVKFECKFCHKILSFKDRLKRHELEVHTLNEKEEICDICFRKFKTTYDLKYHENFAHAKTTFRPKCEPCGKYFSFKTSLVKHIAVIQVRPERFWAEGPKSVG